MVMDFRRTCFVEWWRVYQAPQLVRPKLPVSTGSNAAIVFGTIPPLVRIRWYWAPEGARRFPAPQIWNSDDWDNAYERSLAVIGPDPTLPKSYTSGATPRGVTGQHFCGRLADFQNPVVYTGRPGLRRRPDGIPYCCAPGFLSGIVFTTRPLVIAGSVGWVKPLPFASGGIGWTAGTEGISAFVLASGTAAIAAAFVLTSGTEGVAGFGLTSGTEGVAGVGWGPVQAVETMSSIVWSGATEATPAGLIGWEYAREARRPGRVGWLDSRSGMGLAGWNGGPGEIFGGAVGWTGLDDALPPASVVWGGASVAGIGWQGVAEALAVTGWNGDISSIVPGLLGLTTIAIAEEGAVGFNRPLPIGLAQLGWTNLASALGLIGWTVSDALGASGSVVWGGFNLLAGSIGWNSPASVFGQIGWGAFPIFQYLTGSIAWGDEDWLTLIGGVVWTGGSNMPAAFMVQAVPKAPETGPQTTLGRSDGDNLS